MPDNIEDVPAICESLWEEFADSDEVLPFWPTIDRMYDWAGRDFDRKVVLYTVLYKIPFAGRNTITKTELLHAIEDLS